MLAIRSSPVCSDEVAAGGRFGAAASSLSVWTSVLADRGECLRAVVERGQEP